MPEIPEWVEEWLKNPPLKVCTRCGKAKPQEEFPRLRWNACKDCLHEYDARYKATHREEVIQDRIEYRSQRLLDNARRRGFEIIEVVDQDVVFERDGGICQLCGEPIDPSLDRRLDPMGATIHHTVPVHSYATVQLAHRKCNSEAERPW